MGKSQYVISIMSFLLILLIGSCKESAWEPAGTIMLEGISPIGISFMDSTIWIADGDNNRVITINENGQITNEINPVERPMHITSLNGLLYVPSYTNDVILIYQGENVDTVKVDIELDAPSGVDLMGNRIIIADFYNHQLVYNDGQQWKTIGQEGSENGQLNYPTDVQFHKDKIYVADAYNNRAQVFDLSGQYIMTMGSDLDLNAATGIYVTDNEIFLTDFENDRVVIFDHSGSVKQYIDTGLNKPTDVIIINEQLWILNYMGKYITRYSK